MKKDTQILIKVSETEKEGFKKASEIAGIGLSAWARQKLRSAAIKDLQEVGEKIPFLEQIKIDDSNG